MAPPRDVASGHLTMNSSPTDGRNRTRPDGRTPDRSVQLAAAVDDRRNPTTVTFYPTHGRNRTTRWLSIDVDWVVSLDEMV